LRVRLYPTAAWLHSGAHRLAYCTQAVRLGELEFVSDHSGSSQHLARSSYIAVNISIPQHFARNIPLLIGEDGRDPSLREQRQDKRREEGDRMWRGSTELSS
jgi:hypothetical protein